MRPLKLSFALILIGSVLFLSGASESLEPNPNRKLQEIKFDKHKNTANKIQISTANQLEEPTPFQTEILKALRATRDQIKAASEQYDASQTSWDSPSVLVQIGLVIVGIGYTIFAAFQWWAIRRQANIADKTLSAIKHQATVANTALAFTLRPQLIVRNVKTLSDTQQDIWIVNASKFYLEVVNRGGSATKIRDGKVVFMIDDVVNPDFMKRPLIGVQWENLLSGEVLNPGFERPYEVTYEAVSAQKDLGTVEKFKNGNITIYAIGSLLYQDGIGNHYKTAFCRRFDRSLHRFVTVDDPDHEYAD